MGNNLINFKPKTMRWVLPSIEQRKRWSSASPSGKVLSAVAPRSCRLDSSLGVWSRPLSWSQVWKMPEVLHRNPGPKLAVKLSATRLFQDVFSLGNPTKSLSRRFQRKIAFPVSTSGKVKRPSTQLYLSLCSLKPCSNSQLKTLYLFLSPSLPS